MNRILLASVFFSLFVISCMPPHKHDDKMCTEIYVTIAVTVTDSLNNPVVLDYFEVRNVNSNELLPIHTDNISASEGRYILLTDSEIRLISENGTLLRFTGYKNNAVLVTGDYLVNQDGCHVNLLSGSSILIAE